MISCEAKIDLKMKKMFFFSDKLNSNDFNISLGFPVNSSRKKILKVKKSALKNIK